MHHGFICLIPVIIARFFVTNTPNKNWIFVLQFVYSILAIFLPFCNFNFFSSSACVAAVWFEYVFARPIWRSIIASRFTTPYWWTIFFTLHHFYIHKSTLRAQIVSNNMVIIIIIIIIYDVVSLGQLWFLVHFGLVYVHFFARRQLLAQRLADFQLTAMRSGCVCVNIWTRGRAWYFKT